MTLRQAQDMLFKHKKLEILKPAVLNISLDYRIIEQENLISPDF